MPTLFITAGHSRADTGASANGLLEGLLTIGLRNMVTAECRALGAEVWNDADTATLPQVIRQLNRLSSATDTVLDIHFNSGPSAAAGVEAYVAVGATNAEKQLAAALCAVVSQVLGTPNRGVKPENQSQHPRLGILHVPGRNVLLEVAFITNRAEITRYQTDKLLVAKRMAQVLVPLPV